MQTANPAYRSKNPTEQQMHLQKQIQQIDYASTVDQLLGLVKKSDQTMSQIHLLGKIATKVQQNEDHNREKTNRGDVRKNIIKHEGFQDLLKDIKEKFKSNSDGMNSFKRNTILFSLQSLRYRDDEILDMACEGIMKDKSITAKTLTSSLYLLAKFKYKPDESFLKKSCEVLKNELVLPVDLACRNLWNFYSLDYYDPKLFDMFSEIIVKNHEKVSEIDVANALSSFLHFKHS